jgi:hypothetical protein
MRQLTVPVGRIVRYVKLQLNGQNRNQASGGSCNALSESAKIDTAVLVACQKGCESVCGNNCVTGIVNAFLKKRTGT